jgi:hypothetical protein
VAIFFHEKPTQEMIDVIKERATQFAKHKDYKENKIKVTGFRLLKEEKTTTEIEL